MSINSMTNAAAQRMGTFPAGPVVASVRESGLESAAPSAAGDRGVPAGNPPKETATEKALNTLFGYIPTEVVTLYVAVLAAIGQKGTVTCAEWATFGSFLLACPVVFWLTYAAKLKNHQQPLPLHYSTWPIWEMSAATVSFGTWAFALPESPFSEFKWYSSALSGVTVLITSTVLGLIAPLFQQPPVDPPPVNPPPVIPPPPVNPPPVGDAG